jgi:hypothetical protein
MSTLLLERPRAREGDFERHHRNREAVSERPDAYGGLTLDDLITGVWESLAVRAAVTCPVCEGPMASGVQGDEGASPTSACLNCGSRLS